MMLTVCLIVYILIFMVMSIMDIKHIKGFNDFAVAGKNQSLMRVVLTLMATILGASTTMGVVDTVYQIGFPGIWWLLFGSVGLILQSFILSEKVRSLDADTLPHLAGKLLGRPAEIVLALIIVVSWIGIIAGQLVALNGIITYAFGKSNTATMVVISLFVIAYTMIGGQMSVVKTDMLQFAVIIIGIMFCFFYLFFAADPSGISTVEASDIQLINESYGAKNLITQFFVIGGVYFIGPDIMSRNFMSKDGRTAKKAALIAAIILAVFAVFIVLIGVWARRNVSAEDIGSAKVLMYVSGLLPKPVMVLLVLGLLSAVLSSTDTCIINAASIFVKDILGKESIAGIRVTVGVIGVLATIFAVSNGDIISILSKAYSVYTPGIIFPLFIAIMCYGKRQIKKGVWLTAVCAGGIIGLVSSYFPAALTWMGLSANVISNLTLIGMGISLVIALASIGTPVEEA